MTISGSLVPLLATGIGIDWTTVVAQIVNFLVLVWLLKRFLYGPITRAMDERERSIAERRAEAERAHETAEEERDRYESLIAEHERDVEERAAAARDEAEQIRSRLLEDARNDVETQRREWTETFERERDRTLERLQQQVVRRVVDGAERVLQLVAGSELEDHVINVFLERLDGGERLPHDWVGDRGETVLVRTTSPPSEQTRARIEVVLDRVTNGEAVRFETTSDFVCGISVTHGGHVVEWTVDSALAGLRTDEEPGRGEQEWITIPRGRTA